MAKVVSLGKVSAHPREKEFRLDFKMLTITLNGNRVDNSEVMRAQAGPDGYVDQYRFDMNTGKRMMITPTLPDTIKVPGNVSIVGPAKAPCSFCSGVRQYIKNLKKWWDEWQ